MVTCFNCAAHAHHGCQVIQKMCSNACWWQAKDWPTMYTTQKSSLHCSPDGKTRSILWAIAMQHIGADVLKNTSARRKDGICWTHFAAFLCCAVQVSILVAAHRVAEALAFFVLSWLLFCLRVSPQVLWSFIVCLCVSLYVSQSISVPFFQQIFICTYVYIPAKLKANFHRKCRAFSIKYSSQANV